MVLLAAALVLVGLTGRAAADTTPPPAAVAKPAASAPAAAQARKKTDAAKPAAPSSAEPAGQPSAKPSAQSSAKPSAKPKAAGRAKPTGGPAGSRSTTGNKSVALTFDDGPDPQNTPKILKLLAQHHVHATFCLVGKNVRKHPGLVRQIVAAGHTLCNHTWNHNLKLGKAPAKKIQADLDRTNAAIRKAAPKAKIAYFRAPGGNFTPRLVGTAKRMGMTSIYWKVDPRDWHHPKGETRKQHKARVIRQVEKHTRQGAIVLSHDYAQPDTIAAYRELLPWLRKRFRLEALPD
jgi:peptidoglycan/xylan/chitin deacetylase (PgdA/CDA1 family)